ncbi:class F sortase [Streptomyces sp. NPDC090127]|uniref:class F sortase n=1 Tax=Streptomyces sp. NPDC090127 TaxID=3365953 RepID=UPI003800D551
MFWTLLLAVLLLVLGPGMGATPDAKAPDKPAASAPDKPAASAPDKPAAPAPGRAPAAVRDPASSPAPDGSRRASPSAVPSDGLTMPRSAPVRLRIPKIAVNAPFTGLDIGPSGALDPPPADDTNLVGWHASGVSPGEQGTALIAGHLDTVKAPAVFARLRELDPGDSFTVERSDGTTATFLVDSVEEFRKDDFPDKRVYDDTPDALVRLITCAGAYDRAARDYTQNLVVFAHLEPAD